jgi:hypothetical protein
MKVDSVEEHHHRILNPNMQIDQDRCATAAAAHACNV